MSPSESSKNRRADGRGPTALPPNRLRPTAHEYEVVGAWAWSLNSPESAQAEVVELPISRAELDVLHRAIFQTDPVTSDVAVARTLTQDLLNRLGAMDKGTDPQVAYDQWNRAPAEAQREDEWLRRYRRERPT